ncbi:hypothetical protein [Parachitinimonas caeni]|uniref:Lipoprotein n=1 Tax=Parachitinimonas caeni TaxID=3031301 RepID=A0ABT7E3U6_9NEIS|nr:hypothetical protein [Parachitinimonas caeni]MDK2126993.1 hypothetical protein [Parachitinimonas caeni]
MPASRFTFPSPHHFLIGRRDVVNCGVGLKRVDNPFLRFSQQIKSEFGMFRGILFSTLLAVFLSGCASTPPQFQSIQPKRVDAEGYKLGRSSLLDVTNNTQKHIDDKKNILYFQNQGGGGAAMGVVLGVIGAVANAAMIEGNTTKDVQQLKNRLVFDPRDIFKEAAERASLKIGAGSSVSQPIITPYVYVSKGDKDNLLVCAAVLVEASAPDSKWVGKYMYQAPRQYTIEQLANLDENSSLALKGSLAEGFEKIILHIGQENPEMLKAEKPITFRSELLSPRFDFEMVGNIISDDTEIVWLRTVGGVYAVRKSSISYTYVPKQL